MLRKNIRWLYDRLFHSDSPLKMTIASCLGVLIAALPLFKLRFPLLFLIAVIFRLNIVSVLFGTIITFLGHGMALIVSRDLGISYFNKLLFLSDFYLKKQILRSISSSIVLMPFFLWFYKLGAPNKKLNQGDIDTTSNDKAFVFYDPGSRWLNIKRFSLSFLVISVIFVIVFSMSIKENPLLPNLALKGFNRFSHINPISEKLSDDNLTKQLRKEEKNNPDFRNLISRTYQKNQKSASDEEVYGFFVNWDENSLVSLKSNIHAIDVLIPEWYHLDKDMSLASEEQHTVELIAKSSNIKIMPLVNNYVDGNWNEAVVHNMLSSSTSREKVVNELFKAIKDHGFSGINIDFEGMRAEDKDLLTEFMKELYQKFHHNGLKVTMDVLASNPVYDYSNLSKNVDRMIVMLYDEHYQSGQPGPIASNGWFQQTLDSLDIPANKIVVSLGNYGYDWLENNYQNSQADVMTFGDIMQMADDAKLKIQWDNKSGNPYLRYQDGDDKHIIWFLDGATLYNQYKMAIDDNIKGVAVWRLGSEDPAIWSEMSGKGDLSSRVNDIRSFSSPDPVHYSGEGEILRITSISTDGKRSIQLNSDEDIVNESYVKMAKPFEIQRFGKPKGKEVVLTFDDGPDPLYTKQILDILDRYKVKASFFVVGENAEVNSDLITRMYNDGQEIGNHTFTHPNVANISPLRAKLELNANQRLIQEITGHSMSMFRPPFVADAEPSSPNELLPILRGQEMGYTMIGELIDTEDWQKPSRDEILKRVIKGLPNGNIILLHDAGGDRSNTVKALPKIIETLKSKGYKFVTISSLLGKTRNDIMPPIKITDNPFIFFDSVVFSTLSDWRHIIADLFYLAIIIGIFRFGFLLVFAGRQRRRYKNLEYNDAYKPFVSVVIAAYNEEKVICKTINSIIQSEYPDFEILVVDDGSKDNTSAVIEEMFINEPRVRLIKKSNGGKASAINLGFREAKGEIVVALDADTIIDKKAISLLVRHFIDEKVAAVSGNVKAGNINNLLTLWQHVEYVTGFNLERRAFDELGCITVVPGAIGAWRKEAVAAVGFYKEDTLAEDTDITLSLLSKDYHIAYEEAAYAYTETPADVSSLLKQRFRWTYGTLQCLFKHRGALFNKKHMTLGFIALPNMWLFQYVFQSISPIADIYLIIGLFSNNPALTLTFYISFFIIDLLASLYAFKLEKVSPKPLYWLFLQRLLYRQLMTYVIIKSIISAFKGVTVGWNKLQRVGNVENPHM